MTVRLLIGDCRDLLKTLPDAPVHCVVTSPPYWGLRDYGTAKWEGGDAACDHEPDEEWVHKRFLAHFGAHGAPNTQRNAARVHWYAQTPGKCPRCSASKIDSQLGLEKTPDEYVANMVAVFREVRRVLRDDGTLWLNLGDSYAGSWKNQGRKETRGTQRPINGPMMQSFNGHPAPDSNAGVVPDGLKPKDLVGIPWRVAFALQADGWYLRSDIIEEVELYCPCGCGHVMEERIWRYGQDRELIWKKPNPMPESVRDRPTKAHEYLFLLTKAPSYYYDADVIAEPVAEATTARDQYARPRAEHKHYGNGIKHSNEGMPSHFGDVSSNGASSRNRRSVWTVATRPYKGAHFATFPPKLIEPCILAGTSPQACEHCAAPWERVIERAGGMPVDEHPDDQGRMKASGDIATDTARRKQLSGARHAAWKAANPDRHIGHRPTCDCENNTGSARCVVLDPFGGAGTTGLVADRLGRDAILIELNEEYTTLGSDRITDDAPLFGDVA